MPDQSSPPPVATAPFDVATSAAAPLSITPTDVAQFIRLDQCDRFLRLRLHERQQGQRFLAPFGLNLQPITPLLTRSGNEFEAATTDLIAAAYPTIQCGNQEGHRAPDNERLLATLTDLAPGEAVVMLQPRLRVQLGAWQLTGDADVVKLTRDEPGRLDILIVDIKSSTAARVEHRLQVGFYDQMIAALLAADELPPATIRTGILYRAGNQDEAMLPAAERQALARQRELAMTELGVTGSLLELVPDPEAYRRAVTDLVTAPGSVAARIAGTPFAELPFHLAFKCDGCLYNELCMKWSAERDNLSLLPLLSAQDKRSLEKAGVATIQQLAHLKEPERDPATGQADPRNLVPTATTTTLVHRLGATWPVGPRLDELIHRARRYRDLNGERMPSLGYIPSKGKGSLPYLAPDQNPNLVRIYLDAQHDYLTDRIYLAGALVTGAVNGKPDPARRAFVVEITDGPPQTAEAERGLLVRWTAGILRAVLQVAAPDENGEAKAPIHLIFYDRYDQTVLMDALSRHAASVLAATPLYDFMSQLAAFDSPVASFLTEEMRELKNYPMVSQSLQSVAKYLKFDWREPYDFPRLFRERLFDYIGRMAHERAGGGPDWYIKRARFSSQIPLEYAYAAWGELAAPVGRGEDRYAPYRGVSRDLLLAFHRRRLEALETITLDFRGNRDTTKAPFVLPELDAFVDRAHNLADALAEFLAIERHVALSQWKSIRQLPPERRALSGETLVVRYLPEDQPPVVAEQNRENLRRRELRKEYEADWRQANPDKRLNLSKDQREASKWSNDGLQFRLRVETEGIDATLDEILNLTRVAVDASLMLHPRWMVDSRLPESEQIPLQPTPRAMLHWSQSARVVDIEVQRDGDNRAVAAFVVVTLAAGGSGEQGFVFRRQEFPLVEGERYTLDAEINSWPQSHAHGVIRALQAGGVNALFDRLAQRPGVPARATWPEAAAAGQHRFVEGLNALAAAGLLHPFADSVREYIGQHGSAPILLVQGPPGTGKSYSTAFALLARLQGALAAGVPMRIAVSCSTHSATDVLLENIAEVQARLRALAQVAPTLFGQYFDHRCLDLPLYRLEPRDPLPPGVLPLYSNGERKQRNPGQALMATTIEDAGWCVAGGTPSAIRKTIVEKWTTKELLGHAFVDCLVLDEASRTNLPEALMAALPLKADGQIIVVGDHRQMPPIVQHDWASERRRTFAEYQTYESLFDTLRDRGLPGKPVFPMIKLDESFRLHRDMAEYLRREVYQHDQINYHSKRRDLIEAVPVADPYLRAVLDPAYPIVVVEHDERASQQRNEFEQALTEPIMDALRAAGYDPDTGLGVVVPHRAQRAAMQQAMAAQLVAAGTDPAATRNAVDTVERYQGGERTVMIVSATESDPAYVLMQSGFLLDPRRLTVALSRAKRKLILVASRSIFEVFSPDEEVFANAQLWKNLLHRTCTDLLWEGEQAGIGVRVWGKPATPDTEATATPADQAMV